VNRSAFLAALNAMPDDAAVTLPVPVFRALLNCGEQRSLLTVDDVAALCKRTAGGVRKWIRQGELKATRVGRRWMVARKDLDCFLSARPGRVQEQLHPSRPGFTPEELASEPKDWREVRGVGTGPSGRRDHSRGAE